MGTYCDQFAEAKMDLDDPGVPSLWIRTLEQPSAWNGVNNGEGTMDSSAVNVWLEVFYLIWVWINTYENTMF